MTRPATASTLFLGVDAGNSKTAALVSTASGEVVGAGRSGCGDIYGAPTPEAAVDEVLAAIGAALAEAGGDPAELSRQPSPSAPPAVAGAAFRLAGVDWPEDAEYWDGALRARQPALLRRTVLNDGYAAIRCGEPSGVGIAVAGGTAAAIAARGPAGRCWDMGWWGQHAMGATGLAGEALKAVFLAELGLAPETGLTRALLTHYGKASVAELNHWLTRREGGAGPRDRTSCARTVTAVADSGDPVAVGIVREQGRRLAMYAGVAARETGLGGTGAPVSVVLSGSVLTAPGSPVLAALLEELPAHVPHAAAHRGVLPPVAGALLDALAENGVAVTPDVVARVAGTMPPADFLAT
ncbi:BadF/BadG/BcrA/BcrD ATPase family protein [Actinacidiphila yeochonensis]|uniref:BadF/BadG/BcrA/BcrD ATPase family protein n=1 Tax=Actinacidiphila yeochonensis TaxID=89050 RepID=UPI00055C1EF8|nr:BadF/BadG/BcrA/BcrD ATPase family protein [Actinacidiphila yeochonensis]